MSTPPSRPTSLLPNGNSLYVSDETLPGFPYSPSRKHANRELLHNEIIEEHPDGDGGGGGEVKGRAKKGILKKHGSAGKTY